MRKWSERTGLPATRLVDGLGIGRSKYYEWRRRYGRVNEHNARVPRDHWPEDWERDAIVADFVAYYNGVRLHSAIGYIAPNDKLEGGAEAILAERDPKLAAARRARQARRGERALTERKEERKLPVAGETEASNAGERPARDSRLGGDALSLRGSSSLPGPPCERGLMDIQSFRHASRRLRGLGQGLGQRAGGIRLPEVAYQREAIVHFTLNQDTWGGRDRPYSLDGDRA